MKNKMILKSILTSGNDLRGGGMARNLVKNFPRTFLLIFVLIFSLSFVSCNKNDEETIVLDSSQPLALAPDVFWAVVVEPYAAYKKEMGWASPVTGHCRKGQVLQVLGKSIDENNEEWYHFEEGWLSANCLSVYSNRYKAKAAADGLLTSEVKN